MSEMLKKVWSILSFPDAAFLGNRVPKKLFLESDDIATSDKKLFKQVVKKIHWKYTLKPSTCPVLPFKDHEREYLEVAVLEVEMNGEKGLKRCAEIIHRLIPYPLMLCFYVDSGPFALSIAPKRFSQAQSGAFVCEGFFTTDWLLYTALSEYDSSFVHSLAWDTLPLHTYGSLYNAWMERFIAYECAQLSGKFIIRNDQARLEELRACRQLESSIKELRAQLKKSAFNKQVELNTQIKKLEQELTSRAASL